MRSWGLLRRRSVANPIRSHQQKQHDASRSWYRRGLRIEQFEERILLSIGTWTPIGPAPIDYAQTENVAPTDTSGKYLNEVTGGVQTVAAHPTNANVLYVGTTNGGIWRTSNALAASPTWTPLTDLNDSLSIGAISFDPTDATGQTLVAGIGRFSDYSRTGGALAGVLRTTDGGATWTELNGGGALTGLNIIGIAARGNTILVAADNSLTATYASVGIFRSTDGGATFTQISKTTGATNGLPGGIAYDLAADPTNSNVFYTAVVGATTFGGKDGIYKTADAGATWTKVSSTSLDSLLTSSGTNATHRVQISVGASNQVYVGIVNQMTGSTTLDQLAGVFRSGNGGTTWTKMDVPKITVSGTATTVTFQRVTASTGDALGTLPSGQGTVTFSIVADPSNPNIVYIGCDAQPAIGTASSIGATDYSGLLFRGDASKMSGSQWASLTNAGAAPGGTKSNSSPHAQSRDMTFNANGQLIEGDDGGIYLRTSPADRTGDWYSLNGNLQIAEITTVAYDDISNVAIAAAQSTGVSSETTEGSLAWTQTNKGSGGELAVDDLSLAAQNQSYRYTGGTYLSNFQRQTYDVNGVLVPDSTVSPALSVIGTTKTFTQVDGGQYYTPITVNVVDPSRIVIGGLTSMFESADRGATLTNLAAAAAANAIVYGGYQNGAANAEVLWVATKSGVYLRSALNGALTKVSSVAALDIAVDPTDWSKAYVVTATSIQYTANAGATWTDITAGYAAVAGAAPAGLRGVTVVGSGKSAAVVVVGSQGLFVSQSRSFGTWSKLGTGVPNVPILDVTYNAKDNVLLAGTLGRGVWQFSNPLAEIYGSLQLLSVDTNVSTYQATAHPTITVSPTSLTLHFNDTTIDSSTLSGIQITRAGANGKFYDPISNPNDTDDVVVVPGYIGIGDSANEVVIRFANTLADDLYRVTIVGQGVDGKHTYYGPDGKPLSAFTNTAGMPVGFSLITAADTTEYWDGKNVTWDFNLNLAAQVTAVVPQPITRSATGALSQARDQIQVYFSGAMNAASAQTLSYYSLIATWDTANTADDIVFTPIAAVYDSTTNMVTLTFSSDLALLNINPTNNPNKNIKDCSFRLRVGNAYQTVGSSSGGQGGNIVTTDRTGLSESTTLVDIGSLFEPTVSNPVAATDLGNFSTYSPFVYNPLDSSTGQSWVLSGDIGTIAYSLVWPGGSETAGVRNLPTGATDVLGENHTLNGADTTDGISTYYYNFQSVYGTVAGQTVLNQITAAEKQRVREIFSLCTQYFGVQFVETASDGITVAVGDLRAVDATLMVGPGSPAGIASTDPAGLKAIVNSYYDWSDSSFGSEFMAVMMHEILHTLGFGHSYDLSPGEIMGSSESGVASGTGETADTIDDGSFPGNGDIVSGQYMYRNDSMDIDLYKFSVDKTGYISAETIAQRLQNASLLNTALVLYNSNHEVIARNDDYYGHDSFVNLLLTPGTYYIGVSSSGNAQYDPDIVNSGIGGTTEGSYQLRLTFQPQVTTQLVDARGAALDGDADGTAGGQYNFWFNVNTASTTAADNHTLIVDKASTSSTANGTLANPYKTISAALAAAKAGDIVRVVGNNYDNDNQGHSIQAVAAAGVLLDGQKFTISDATKTFTFELDTNNQVTAGNIRVAITSTDTAATIATKLATAINSISWIPPGLGQAGVTRYSNGLYARATVTGTNSDIVSIDGPTVTIDLGTSKLKSTLQDNKAYEIGANPQGATLSDGKNIDLPKGVTMMIDAGALLKLRGANIDAGDTPTADRTRSALQVLGTPSRSVTFTSYKDETLGVDTYSPPTSATAGDWGGLVFANDYAAQASDLTYQNLEREGIFVNYVNFADIRYGGGQVTVDSAANVYDPITMIDSRPTVSNTTITHAADAAMSADPHSLLESEFRDGFGEKLYTADYGRVGPDLHGNTLVNNSLNALRLRVATVAGQATEEVDVPARFDDVGTVLAIQENVTISSGAGEAVSTAGTCLLQAGGRNQLLIPIGAVFTDGQYFTISDGDTAVRFEIDTAGNGVHANSVPVNFATGSNYSVALAAAISNAATILGIPAFNVKAIAGLDSVTLSGSGKAVIVQGLTGQTAQIAGRLAIDAGSIVKLSGTRIEAGFGADFIAEGTAAYPIVFTSTTDDSYGAGGTFDTTNNSNTQVAAAGNWGGIYFNPTSVGSIDHACVFYAGGSTAIEGKFAVFAPIELRQATVRVANSLFQHNAASTTSDERNGRGPILQAAVIYGTFSQPVLVNNIIRDNQGAAISLDVNSLNSLSIADWGRCTGSVDAYAAYDANYGPLVRGNHLTGNSLNGLVVRAGTLTTEGIWDDTDIVHIVLGAIDIPNVDTYGGLRLQSTLAQSLVIKLKGTTAGFTASGRPLEITDRIGGSLQVLGTAGHPVVLTSLADDTIGAGLDPNGNPMTDTDNSTSATAKPGDWQGISLAEYSNDRNVGVVNETELSTGLAVDINGGTGTAQYLGQLAQDVEGGDNTLRLGFQVNGTIAYDRPNDVDVYSFTATAGTEVWIAIDRSSFSLDTVLELVDANGNILASSDDWRRTSTLTGDAMPMDKGMGYDDVYSTNWSDAGMRLKLRGATGTQGTYYIRVHSAAPESANAKQTTGHYQLQVRLQPVYEHPGSTISYADIRYAVTGIDVSGLPGHSVLTTDIYDADTSTVAKNDTAAQPAGNLLQSDEGMLNIGGYLNSWNDVDWYRFSINYGNTIENISGVTSDESVYPVILDLDFADGLNRPDATIWLYEEYTEVVNNVSQTKRRLIYSGSNSNIADDLAGLGNGSASDILGSGSYGANDASIGPIYLKEGHNYYVAVTSTAVSADAANPAYNATLHFEPVSTTKLVAEDHIGTTSASSYTLFPGTTTANLNLAAQDYQLNDVGFYVMTDTGLCMVDPFTGKVQAVSDNFLWAEGNNNHGVTYGDLVMRNDGKLYTISRGTDDGRYNKNSYAGFLAEIDTGDPSNFLSVNPSGIVTYGIDPTDPNKINIVEFGDDANETGGIRMEAVCYQPLNPNGSTATSGRTMYAIGNDPVKNTDVNSLPEHNLLYVMYEDGEAYDPNGADQRLVTSIVPLGALQVNGTITGMSFLNGRLYCVTDIGGFYEITNYKEQGFKEVGDGKTKPFSIEAMPSGGPSAKLICTIDPDPTSNVAFAGLTAGPSNVENEKYANMVFAVTRTGDVYALNVTLSIDPISAREVTTVTKAPIFFDGATSVNTGIGSVSGLAFSTLDYNLWHATTSNSYTGDSGDTGDMSFYFGLEKDAGQPDAVNYYGTNQAIYNTYDLPGGAHGSIVTQKFDLSQYAAADQPTLYFHYSLDKDISTTSTDAATVYASSDGINWSSLGTLGDTAGIWSEVSLSLASFAGESSVQLRFDFTTGGAWANTVTLNGSDLVAPSGEGLEDGDTFIVAYADGKTNPTTLATTETFEFDMGVSLHMPNVAGDAIPDGETFTVTDSTGAVLKTFEFDRDGNITAGNVAIAIQNGETSAEVAALVAKAINGEHLLNSLGIAIAADVYKTRVMLNFAEGVTQAAVVGELLPSVTTKGDGYGTTTTGNRVLPITSFMTADEVAKEIATGKDPAGHTVDALGRVLDGLDHVFAADGEAFKYDGNLVYLIGHKITDAGPLSSVSTTPDPVYMATKPLTDGNADFRRAAGNAYGGLYLDDIIIGFAERGQQYTGALANVMSFSTPTAAPAGTVTQGYYQLQIRLASDFGTWKKGDTTPTITQTIDTNDRLSSEYTLTVPPAMNIRNGATFTVSDGISTVTFQLLDPNNVSTANPEYLAVHFTADQTAGEVASAIAAAINNAEAAGLLNVTAACNGTGTNVDLFGATSLTDISDKITITAPAGKDIATGTTFIVEGVNTLGVPTIYNFQFVNSAFGGGDGKSKVVSYTSAYTAHEVAMAISNAINLAAVSLVNPFTVSAVLDDICGDRVVLTNAVRVTGISVTATAVRFNDLGDENQLYDQGQVLLQNNTITYCSGWGIVVSAGTLRSDSTGFDMPKALPGPTAPLVTVNADHQVPGVTIENNVIAYSGSGGIHLSGDSTAVGAVPFARVVNNTIYGATSTSASQSGLSGSGISSSSGIQLSQSVAAVGYDGDTSAYVGLGDATPTGTTYLVTNQYGGNWYDAEKQLPDSGTRPGSGDDLMCWAASASNILAWTGWGIVNGMTTADSIFKYFQDHWTDDAGWGTYGWYWWFTGIDAAAGMGVSNVDVPGGNFYPGVDSSNYIEETVDTTLAMRAIDVYLRADYGVTLGLYWPDTGAGHEITCWGFTYDSTKATNDPGYYTGVYVTDSDDDKSTTNALSAPDRLRYYNVAYSSSDQRWYLQDFYGTTSTVPYIGHVSGLKQNESTPGPGTVGNGIGILVDNNASPTILNNVIAKCVTGISVGSGCGTTVIGATSYYANGTNLLGTTDTFGSTLVTDPFVNASAGNFYPSQGSLIIDSSLDSLVDRPNMANILKAIGLSQSPILAPSTDLLGQVRTDDASVTSPQGLGQNAYKDRGAIDRTDWDGPIGSLLQPVDNDTAGVDRDSATDSVLVAMNGDVQYAAFTVQLNDGGAGIADYSVTSSRVQLYEDDELLVDGRDYFFTYDSATKLIKLTSAAGVWAPKHTYRIELSGDIQDLAGNGLAPNGNDGTETFVIALTGWNFGTAPMYTDSSHTTSATSLPNGARHLVVPSVHLGNSIGASTDAYINANGDADNDGIVFQDGTNLVSMPAASTAATKTIVVTASVAGYLDAWIDWNNDGVWDPATEKLAFTDADGNPVTQLVAGQNTLTFTVPAGIVGGSGVSSFETFARFRFSTTGKLADGSPMAPTGEASDGEVEDYQLTVTLPPGSISGTVSTDRNGNGAHDAGDAGLAGWTVFIDANNNGTLDTGEVSTVTDANGDYQFLNVSPGDYYIRQVVQQPGWTQTGTSGYLVTVNNGASVTGNNFFDRETVAPTVKSIVLAGASPTNAGTVQFTVTFSEEVDATTVDAADFKVIASSGLTGPFNRIVTGSGDTYTVTVTTGSGSGTLQLNLADNDTIKDLSGNVLGGAAGIANGDFAGPAYTIDKLAPTVTSIELTGDSPTRAATVSFIVTFSEPVTGVDEADFAVVTSGLTGTFTPVVTGSGSVYTVTVSTGSGTIGTLQLNLVDNDSIVDVAGNVLGGVGLSNGDFAGPTCDIDRTIPMVGWVDQAGSTGDEYGQSIVTDYLGNVYVAGTFHGTVDFDPSSGTNSLTSAGGADAFVAAYSYSGDLLWVRDMGGAGDDFATSLTLGADGSVYLGGSFCKVASFFVGSDPETVTTLTATGSPDYNTQDAFLAKLDSSGNLLWAHNMGGTGDDVVNSIALGSDGSVYATGYFQGTADFNPGDATSNLTAVGPKDVFVTKLDADGNFVWAGRMGGTGWAQGMSIGNGIAVSAADDSVYVTGSFQGTADFDPSTAQSTLTCAGDTDVFVAKLDSAGNFVWARRMGGTGADYGSAIAIAADGSVYTTGDFLGLADFDPGAATFTLDSAGYHRTFISKLDAAGNFVWARAAGGTSWDLATGISVGTDGSVYTTGGFSGIADFNPGAGTYNLTSLGQKDTFVLKLDSTGDFAWARRAGGTGDDCANGITVGANGIVYTTGYYQNAADFDAGTSTFHLTNAGGKDVFVSKLIPPNSVLTTTINQAPTQADPASSSPVVFRVVFSNAVTDFAAADVTLGGTAQGTLVATVVPVGTDGMTYDVYVTGMIGSGTVTATIAAAKAHDSLGNANQASTSIDNSVVVSLQPAFNLTGPTSGVYTAGSIIPIQWTAANMASTDKVTLFLDRDGVFNGNETAIEIDQVAATAGSYSWTTPASLAAGTYYIAGYAYSGGKAYYSHLTQPFTVQGVGVPTFALTAPTSGTYTAGSAIPIQWNATNVAASDKVTLFLDKDGLFNGNETAIEVDQAAATAGAYSWTSPANLASGTYYVAGYLYSGGKAYYSHLTQSFAVQGVGAPTFALTGPTSGAYTAGSAIPINWTATNVAAGDKVTLFVDRDGTFNGNETAIEVDQVAATAGSYTWTTPANLASGTYYIAGYAYSGGKAYYSHLTQPFTVQGVGTPSFALTGPTSGAYTAGSAVPINWTATNVAAGDKVTLFFDRDGVFNGNETAIEVDQVAATAGSYTWTTPANLASGNYYIAGYAYSGGKAYLSHLTQSFTVQANSGVPSFALSGPTSGTYTAGSSIAINWTATNAAAGDKVTLFYDRDGAFNGNETAIEVDQAAASAGTYTWTTPANLASGKYYVAGYLYSGGKAYLSHLSQSFTIASPLSLAASSQSTTSLSSDEVLDSQDELAPIVSEAIRRLASQAGSQVLADVKVEIADLPGALLGEQIGNTIVIDRDAAGSGWFIDSTPSDDAEFTQLASDVLVARPQTAAAGHADLLTTVMHEMGHVLGYDHDAGQDLMSASLPVSQRRLPAGSAAYLTAMAARNNWGYQPSISTGALDSVFASSDEDGKNDLSWL